MEWVEVRGETLAAAKEEALDQLGVARDEAEFEVVRDAESRWLGLRKTEARVRARVRPTKALPKNGSTNRSRGSRGRGSQSKRNPQSKRNQQDSGSGSRAKGQKNTKNARTGDNKKERSSSRDDRSQERGVNKQKSGSLANRNSQGKSKKQTVQQNGRTASVSDKEKRLKDDAQSAPLETVSIEEQRNTAIKFLDGVVSGFGVDATVNVESIDDKSMFASVEGSDLGLMVGPRGGTLNALQDLTRAALQRMSDGRQTSRLVVDVAGYRDRRRSALVEFVGKQAAAVKANEVKVALEPMTSIDRKTVHDAVLEIDGVKSISEGDEPRRHVVLLPDS